MDPIHPIHKPLPCDHLGPSYRGIDLRCGLPLGHVGDHSKDGYVWDRSVWDRSEPATSESFVKPATSESFVKLTTVGDLASILIAKRLSLNLRREGDMWIATAKLLDGVTTRSGVRCIEVSDTDLTRAIVAVLRAASYEVI